MNKPIISVHELNCSQGWEAGSIHPSFVLAVVACMRSHLGCIISYLLQNYLGHWRLNADGCSESPPGVSTPRGWHFVMCPCFEEATPGATFHHSPGIHIELRCKHFVSFLCCSWSPYSAGWLPLVGCWPFVAWKGPRHCAETANLNPKNSSIWIQNCTRWSYTVIRPSWLENWSLMWPKWVLTEMLRCWLHCRAGLCFGHATRRVTLRPSFPSISPYRHAWPQTGLLIKQMYF